MTLPMAEAAPASGRLTSVRPNGQSAKLAIWNDAIPNGIVMMRMNITSRRARSRPPARSPQSTSQITLRMNRIDRAYDKRRDWLRDAERLDLAVYAAIAKTPTPALDTAMARLTRAADYSKISIGASALLAGLGGRAGGALPATA